MKITLIALSILMLASCKNTPKNTGKDMNVLAERYLRLGLAIGQYDGDFVDAYYGPDSLKPAGNAGKVFPKDSLLAVAAQLQNDLKAVPAGDSINAKRAGWLSAQLTAFSRRIKTFSGETVPFDAEAQELFGVKPPQNSEQYFKDIVNSLDKTLPGPGTIDDRFKKLSQKFIIPENKIDTIFRTAIAEARRRTCSL